MNEVIQNHSECWKKGEDYIVPGEDGTFSVTMFTFDEQEQPKPFMFEVHPNTLLNLAPFTYNKPIYINGRNPHLTPIDFDTSTREGVKLLGIISGRRKPNHIDKPRAGLACLVMSNNNYETRFFPREYISPNVWDQACAHLHIDPNIE